MKKSKRRTWNQVMTEITAAQKQAEMTGHSCQWCGGRGVVDRGLTDPYCGAQEARKRIPCPKCEETFRQKLGGSHGSAKTGP